MINENYTLVWFDNSLGTYREKSGFTCSAEAALYWKNMREASLVFTAIEVKGPDLFSQSQLEAA